MSMLTMDERVEVGAEPEPTRSVPHPMEMEEAELRAWEDVCRALAEAGMEGVEAVRMGGGGALFAPRSQAPGLNRAFGLPPGRIALPELASALIGAYGVRGIRRFRLELLPGVPGPAGLRSLRDLGYREGGRTARLYRPAGDAPWVVTDLEVVAAEPGHRSALRALGSARPDAPDAMGAWLAMMVGRPGWHVFLTLGRRGPVAAGAFHVQGDWGWIGGSAVLPSDEGRGARHALLAELVLQATRQGCRHLVMEAGEDPVAGSPSARAAGLGMGFREMYRRTTWVYEAAGPAVGPAGARRVLRWLGRGQVGVGSVKP